MTDKQDARDMLDRAERAATAGDLASADELLRGAARLQEEELGPLHPDLANTLNNLAIVAEKTGRASEAEALYRRAAAIAAAAFPSDHPMVVASRQNLEDFCRANGLSIDAPAAITPTRATEQEAAKAAHLPSAVPRPNPGVAATIATLPSPPAPIRGRTSHVEWAATGTVVLVAVMLVWRPWSRDAPTPAPTPEPAAAQQTEVMPPRIAPPTTPPPAPIERTGSPAAASPREDKVATKPPPSAGGITVATAQLCRTFSTSGSNWRCDPVGQSVTPGPITFYTRVRSPRNIAVVHRWYHGDTLRQSVTLKIQASAVEGYRTYSRLTVDDGDWRLEVRSADGNSLLHEQRFAVR